VTQFPKLRGPLTVLHAFVFFEGARQPSMVETRAAVAELERRAAIEARRDAYGREHCVRWLRGGRVEVEYELGVGQGYDYWEALAKALDSAGAP
jgi:hypothetical protein